MAAPSSRLSILVEHLQPLARVVARAPVDTPGIDSDRSALLRFLSRADAVPVQAEEADRTRCRLFGLEDIDSPPVAALTNLAETGANAAPESPGYWIRIDPVMLRADRMRVFVLGAGMADYDEGEQAEVLRCIGEVLQEQGLAPIAGQAHVRVALDNPLPFRFLPVGRVLGMDLGDALPDHPEARPWRRLANEIQVALHHLPVNQRRRQLGRAEINGAWPWGGGALPGSAPAPAFDRVFSDQPVSRGLARLHKLEPASAGDVLECDRGLLAGHILLDWTASGDDALAEWRRLETLFRWLLSKVHQDGAQVSLHAAGRHEWILTRRGLRRFWRRDRTLADIEGLCE